MRRTLLALALVLALLPAAAEAQQAAKEAEIRRQVPYATMLREKPGMSLLEYEAAVRAVAAQEVAKQRRNVPLYVPPPIYAPPPVVAPQADYFSPYRPIEPIRPRSGSTYDWQSGNLYNWNKQSNGTTDVRGMNLQNGSMWNSTIKPDGSMTGFDKNMNYWMYNSQTGTYMNLGTGELCTGQGAARICTGGR